MKYGGYRDVATFVASPPVFGFFPLLRCLCACDFRFPASFSWSTGGTEIIGQTPTGRVTIAALRLNEALIVAARSFWIGTGVHPPQDE